MFSHDLLTYDLQKEDKELVFFDRSFIDSIGYSKLEKILIPPEQKQAAQLYRFNQIVFMAPPWLEIYENDRERKQSFEEAIATYQQMMEVYKEFGYTICELPKVSVEERLSFLLMQVSSSL